MYLVIKEIRGEKQYQQIALKLYTNSIDAYNYIEQYMKESSGEKWHKELITPRHIYKRYILKQKWFRELKNGDTMALKVKYLKAY